MLQDHQVTNSFYGANHCVLREAIFSLGLYDPILGIRPNRQGYSGNDTDLFEKAKNNGFSVIYNPKIAVEHLIDKSRYEPTTHLARAIDTGKNEGALRKQSCPDPKFSLSFRLCLLMRGTLLWLSAILCRQKDLSFHYRLQVARHLSFFDSYLRSKQDQ